MSRSISTPMRDRLDEELSIPVILGKFEFDSGTVFAWTGVGSLPWNGDIYEGLGQFLEVELPEERSDRSATGATFVLSGIDPGLITIALGSGYRGRPCTLWYGEFDNARTNLLADPVQMFSGKIDMMSIDDSGESSKIQLTVERKNYDSRPLNTRYDDAEQQRRFPGDKGFEYLPTLDEKPLYWGGEAPKSTEAQNAEAAAARAGRTVPTPVGIGRSPRGGGQAPSEPATYNRNTRGTGAGEPPAAPAPPSPPSSFNPRGRGRS